MKAKNYLKLIKKTAMDEDPDLQAILGQLQSSASSIAPAYLGSLGVGALASKFIEPPESVKKMQKLDSELSWKEKLGNMLLQNRSLAGPNLAHIANIPAFAALVSGHPAVAGGILGLGQGYGLGNLAQRYFNKENYFGKKGGSAPKAAANKGKPTKWITTKGGKKIPIYE